MSVERRVRVRRLKRRLKAAASIVLALAAGTFLTCQRTPDAVRPRPKPAPNPSTPEQPDLPPPEPEPVLDQDASEEPQRDAAVDREEHQKGMPVPDNLLE